MIWGKLDTTKVKAHTWYAWYPVRAESGLYVWLENVHRQLKLEPKRRYIYRIIPTELK